MRKKSPGDLLVRAERLANVLKRAAVRAHGHEGDVAVALQPSRRLCSLQMGTMKFLWYSWQPAVPVCFKNVLGKRKRIPPQRSLQYIIVQSLCLQRDKPGSLATWCRPCLQLCGAAELSRSTAPLCGEEQARSDAQRSSPKREVEKRIS